MLMGILTSQDILARCLPTAGRPTKGCLGVIGTR
jgi:hypothetical protein